MGEASGLFALLSGVNAVGSISQGYFQSRAQLQQGRFAAQQANQNAALASLQAEEAIQAGDVESQRQQQKARQVIGAQRASLAAQGIDPNIGTSEVLEEESASMGALDALTIRNNAARQAFGFQVQANNYQSQAVMDKLAARNAANNSLLSGGLGAARDLAYGSAMYNKLALPPPKSAPRYYGDQG